VRRLRFTKRFRKDFQRIKAGRYGPKLDTMLKDILDDLMHDNPLPHHRFDHALTGQWKDYRDCHIKPDLVLIYRKPDDDTLELVRLGSHSDLGF